jgi:hypothetical protein
MKLTKDLTGCTGGAVYPVTFEAGASCPDDLLAAAIETRSLSEADMKAARARLDGMAQKAHAAAPENKAHAGSSEQA